MQENPCLTERWPALWTRLQAAGWIHPKQHQKQYVNSNDNKNTTTEDADRKKKNSNKLNHSANYDSTQSPETNSNRYNKNNKSDNNSNYYRLGFVLQYSPNIKGSPTSSTSISSSSSAASDESQLLVPGVHSFVSRIALMRYIARFPYLLQTTEQIMCTLSRFGWERQSNSNKFRWWFQDHSQVDDSMTTTCPPPRWKFKKIHNTKYPYEWYANR